MQTYIGTKIVMAEPAVNVGGKIITGPVVQAEALDATVREGYKVVYPDGYESWSPKDVFEEAYRPTNGLNFGLALEAAKQSGRALVPEVESPISFQELLRRIPSHEAVLIPWEEERGNGIRKKWLGEKDVAIIIGPEGGMDEKEVARMAELSARPVTLGPRILRTETAGLAAACALFTLSGDME